MDFCSIMFFTLQLLNYFISAAIIGYTYTIHGGLRNIHFYFSLFILNVVLNTYNYYFISFLENALRLHRQVNYIRSLQYIMQSDKSHAVSRHNKHIHLLLSF